MFIIIMEFIKTNYSYHSLTLNQQYCEWRFDIKNCKDEKITSTFQILLLTASIFNFFLFFLTILILYWKLNKSNFYRSPNFSNDKIWKIYEWSSINLILLWIAIYCLFRGFSCLVTSLDLFSSEIIFRVSLFKLSFIPAYCIVLIYLANIFRLIPKLSFNQTSNSGSKLTTIWLPKDKQVTILFWFTILFIIITCISILLVKGFMEETNFSKIIVLILELSLLLIRIFIGFCYIYYGRISVDLTSQSIVLAGFDDINDNNVPNRLSKSHIYKV
ncbi:hypothetical protein C1645_772905, partial [Glomus cerebriforme]